jgi:hypothetical protein
MLGASLEQTALEPTPRIPPIHGSNSNSVHGGCTGQDLASGLDTFQKPYYRTYRVPDIHTPIS